MHVLIGGGGAAARGEGDPRGRSAGPLLKKKEAAEDAARAALEARR